MADLAAPGSPRIALVLGGGGLKGFAHVGALRALESLGVRPTTVAGTSIGALVATAWAAGMSVDEMERRALALRRRDLFRVNHGGLIVSRLRAPSIYRSEPLRALCEGVLPDCRLDELPLRVLVNTVDVEHGAQVVWGRPGLSRVPVRDAVYASCALPGFFPPGDVCGRTCVDGGTIDNLPANIAGLDADLVIAVDVGNADLSDAADVGAEGFASVFMRSASIMMHRLQQQPLEQWSGPPMILVRPAVQHVHWFSFAHTAELVQAGHDAALAALQEWDRVLDAPGGIHPRRTVALSVDRDRCIGCGTCPALAPRHFGLGADGLAFVRTPRVEWSPADGAFIRHCPTSAIEAVVVDEAP